MTLQARLTLWSMLVMAAIVTVVSLTDLMFDVNLQFDAALDHGNQTLSYTANSIHHILVGSSEADIGNVIRGSKTLRDQLADFAKASKNVDQIVVTDTQGRVLFDEAGRTVGQIYTPHNSFPKVVRGRWTDMWALPYNHSQEVYEIAQDQMDDNGKPVITIHVLLIPALLRETIRPILQQHAQVTILSVVFAILAAFTFSTVAFHPLGKLGRMLDLVASGNYELQQVGPSPADEFGIVASKVSMLGQHLRGAQSDFSDLKGNFERLLDELEDAVLIFGRDRRLIAAAGAVDTLLSRSRSSLVGLPVNEIFPPGTGIGLLLAQAMQLVRPVHNRSVPVTLERNGATQLKVLLLTVEFLGDHSGMLIRLRDPEATRQIGRRLQTADRLSAISRLTSGVAHEVKNPLNAILMHVELAKIKLAHGDYDLNPQMDVLSSEILRLDRVVKTFLDFTRPVQLNLRDMPLSELVDDLVELASPQAAAGNIEVFVENSPEPVSITIDPDLFKQAVLNIVVNAIEAMPHGGHLRFWSGVRGDMAEIRISDDGPGIPAEVRDKIYNLYFTTKEKGSGIGLSMTFRIVQLHDGTIDFESEPGKGTTFSLRLPVAVITD